MVCRLSRPKGCVNACNAVIDYIASNAENLCMSILTIRNLDDAIKTRLRLRAAARNRSMEDEVRHILRAAVEEPVAPAADLGARIRARFAGLIDTPLPIPEREAVRQPPDFADSTAAAQRTDRKSDADTDRSE